MHTLKICRPRSALRPYVRIFVQRATASSGSLIVEPVPAHLDQHLTFDFGSRVRVTLPNGSRLLIDPTSIAGALTRVAHLDIQNESDSFGIIFTPTGFSQLFCVPPREFINGLTEASGAIGASVRGVWNRMGECDSFESRVAVAEEFLLSMEARRRSTNIIMSVADSISLQDGVVSITSLARQCSVGLRQFERDFRRIVGMSPKAFARVARFQAALKAKIVFPKRTWLDIAHTFGYYDQMHMIHDFELLGNHAPTELVSRLRDGCPGAYVPEEELEGTMSVLFHGQFQA